MGKILENETLDEYGYDIKDLKPCSCKLVIWKCNKCGIVVEKKYRDAKRINLCLQCSNEVNANVNKDIRNKKLVEWHKNHKHPLEGKERPQYVKDAIRKARTGTKCPDDVKKTLSIKFSGDGNPFHGKKHTEDSLEKMREKSKLNVRKGEDSNFYGKSYHGKGQWYILNEEKIWMRSSWEIKFAEYLDRNKIKWGYEIKPFSINDNETYTPDFYLIDDNKYIEIKGWWREDAKIKYDKFIEKYKDINIEIYDNKKLKEIGVL